MKTLRLLFIILVFIVAPYVWAESERTLSLDEALRLAIKNNPDLQVARAQLGVSEAQILSARISRPNPMFMTDSGIPEKTYRVGVEQTFELGGKRHKRVALAEAEYETREAQVQIAVLDLRRDIRQAFVRLYNVQQQEAALNDIQNLTAQLMKITQKRHLAGDVAGLDVMQARIANLNTVNDLQAVASEVMAARNQLNTLLNQPLETTLKLVSPMQPKPPVSKGYEEAIPLQGYAAQVDMDLPSLIEQAMRQRPEFMQNQRQVVVVERQLALVRANRIPDLSLGAGSGLVYNNNNNWVPDLFITSNVELPVFNRQQGPILEAEARLIQLESEQTALKNRVSLELSNAYQAFVSSQKQIELYEDEILPEAKTVVEKSYLSFKEGKSSILMPLNAQQAYINTRLGYLQAIQDNQNALSHLERAIGGSL